MEAETSEYRELLDRLFRARRFGMKLELERIAGVLARLGSPQRELGAVLHVGGTNGKGSTSAFAEAIARAAGVRVGVYSSPHLSRFTERMRVDGEPMAPDELLGLARRVERADPGDELTFFERVTAIALCGFAARQVELAVLEVGLGGRFDATNVVDADVAVVTGVALDHQEQLGQTLAEIAREKAGIFKRGKRAVIGASGLAEGVAVLTAAAQRAGVSELIVVDDARVAAVPSPLGLAGAYQRRNAAAAIAACEQLAAAGALAVGQREISRGLAAARLAGRMETIALGPEIVVDGAHNAHAAQTLAAELASRGEPRPVAVIGVSKDKPLADIVGPIAAVCAAVVATSARGDRAAPAADVARAVGGRVPVEQAATVAGAVDRGRQLAGAAGRVIVTGSLFVVGEAREHVLGIAGDELLVQDPR